MAQKRYGTKKKYNKYRNDNDKSTTTENRKWNDTRKTRDEFSYDQSHSNDITWWNKATPIFDNVTKIPWNRIYGDRFTMGSSNVPYFSEDDYFPKCEPIPAVMSIDYIPTIGACSASSDAVNLAFDALYARIYREYTGAQNFTKSELAFHVLHAQSIACAIAELKRILRCVNSYALQNHNFPRAIFAACTGNGIDGDDTVFTKTINDLPNLRSRLNQIIYNFNSLYIPKFTDVFDRWYSLSNNVWMDEDNIEATAYIFRSAGYYNYIEPGIDPVTPASLHWNMQILHSDEDSVEVLFGRCETLLSDIRNSANFGIVNAAIAKVYGDNCVKIDYFGQDEVLGPVFDRNMMYQINNMELFGTVSDLDVTEDVLSNILLCSPKGGFGTNWGSRVNYLLNSYDYNIDSEFLMESTRLKPHFKFGTPKAQGMDPGSFNNILDTGTEIPYRMRFYYPDYTDEDIAVIKESYALRSNGIVLRAYDPANYSASVQLSALWPYLSLLTKFRNHPLIYLSYTWDDDTESNPVYAHFLGDISKYTIITDQALEGLNRAALLSAYYISSR